MRRTSVERRLRVAQRQRDLLAGIHRPELAVAKMAGLMTSVVTIMALVFLVPHTKSRVLLLAVASIVAVVLVAITIYQSVRPTLVRRRFRIFFDPTKPAPPSPQIKPTGRLGHLLPARPFSVWATPDRASLRTINEFWPERLLKHDDYLYTEDEQGSYSLQGLVREAVSAPFSVSWRRQDLTSSDQITLLTGRPNLASPRIHRALAALDNLEHLSDPRFSTFVERVCAPSAYLVLRTFGTYGHVETGALQILEALGRFAVEIGPSSDALDYAFDALDNYLTRIIENPSPQVLADALEDLTATTKRLFSKIVAPA